ncbi:MAG: glutamate racemase [Dethiobacteria bacterium]|jgi:glutamate racemase
MNAFEKSIALLDSGVGGLTVVKEIMKQLPKENIVYFGDTARMPYGPRPHEEVRRFALQIIDFLQTQEIKMAIVACNSATAAGLPYYKKELDIPVLGVIEPGVRAALAHTRTKRIGVIGTKGTIESGEYERAIKKLAPDAVVCSRACPLFVLIVENNLSHTPEARRVAEEYLLPLKEQGVDTLILGCTHYPLLQDVIADVMGEDVHLISSAEETAREARQILEDYGLLNPSEDEPRYRFFISSKPPVFEEIGRKILGRDIKAYQVVLDDI